MTNCPICSGEIKQTSKPTTYTYKNHSIELNQSGEYCTQCDEAFLSAKDLKSTKLEIANFKREIDHFLTTDELKRIRMSSLKAFKNEFCYEKQVFPLLDWIRNN